MHLLGAGVTLLKNAVRTRATDERAVKLRGHIAQALQSNYLTPASASKLRGRTGFYTSLLMRRLGRGMMGPLIRRQYGSFSHSLNTDVKRNILWRYNAIGTLPPRSIPLTLFSPMGAHSDAQGNGHISTRALLPIDVSLSTHHPKWFIEMAFAADAESPIYLFELAATVLTACLAAYLPDGNRRTCVLRIDNKAAIDALIKGSSPSALGTVLVNLFWSVAARCPVAWWFEYVDTKSNAADPPSRVCDAPMGVNCTRRSGEIHPEFTRISSSWNVLRREPTLTNK